ncbi:TIGR02466 family protein [uncultured Microbulbifer sp.]|uniref:TIGR02466 family protein n=1 Tax=uncultured Microbulbifer sp. TaxID=348147 RepID=UPI0026310A96|nr:TIGR02466 family protein [uncultured Microbulbifer sp.]
MDTIKTAFSTPILVRDMEAANGVNDRLAEIILDMESRTPGMKRSNIGSWDSQKDFFEWPHEEISTLKKWVVKGVKEITLKATKQKYEPRVGDMLAHAWANVSRADSYRKIHNHESCTWSGVYYVKSDLVKEKSISSGNIEFLDPRMLCLQAELPSSSFGSRVRVVPRPGRLVIFPHWLLHYVNPVEDDSLRICIAFNVKLETQTVRRRSGTMRPLQEAVSVPVGEASLSSS